MKKQRIEVLVTDNRAGGNADNTSPDVVTIDDLAAEIKALIGQPEELIKEVNRLYGKQLLKASKKRQHLVFRKMFKKSLDTIDVYIQFSVLKKFSFNFYLPCFLISNN